MRRWFILATGLTAQATTCSFLYGMPFLIPSLQADHGLSLTTAGVLVSAPLLGLLLALIAWGAGADRFGERTVMTAGRPSCPDRSGPAARWGYRTPPRTSWPWSPPPPSAH